MNKDIPVNGLTLKCLPSRTESLPDTKLADLPTVETLFNIIAQYIQTASLFVAYMDYRVVIGRYADNAFDFYQQKADEQIIPKYLQKLRVFNIDEELLLWRSGQTIKGRFRCDNEGKPTNFVEAKQVLFGTRYGKNSNDRFTEIIEDRGTSVIMPFTAFEIGEEKHRLFIMTRNYIGHNAVHQATYMDCRFVKFTDTDKDLV